MNHWTGLIEPKAVIRDAGQGVRYAPLGPWKEEAEPEPEPSVERVPFSSPRMEALHPNKAASIREHLTNRWVKSYRRRMLAELAEGPMQRDRFRALAREVYEQDFGNKDPTSIPKTLRLLEMEGLIEIEVRLTDAGREKLAVGVS